MPRGTFYPNNFTSNPKERGRMLVRTPHEVSHHGVKGMHWGVRKAHPEGQDHPRPIGPEEISPHGVTIRADGSITIARGAKIQRLVRSNGKSLPMKDITYASINAYDNARYIKVIGGKGFFGGGRDTILSITATKKINAPPIDTATKIVSDLMLHDPQFRKKNSNILGLPITQKELDRIAADPTGKTAQAWYIMTNTKLTFDKEFDPSAPFVQKRFREAFQAKGYSAVRDENDVNSKIARAPVIIFSPEKSLKVVKSTVIDDRLRKANKEQLKGYKKAGSDWVDKQLYS